MFHTVLKLHEQDIAAGLVPGERLLPEALCRAMQAEINWQPTPKLPALLELARWKGTAGVSRARLKAAGAMSTLAWACRPRTIALAPFKFPFASICIWVHATLSQLHVPTQAWAWHPTLRAPRAALARGPPHGPFKSKLFQLGAVAPLPTAALRAEVQNANLQSSLPSARFASRRIAPLKRLVLRFPFSRTSFVRATNRKEKTMRGG